MQDIACQVVVRGMVTGVGFRYAALREVAGHGDIRGYVRNVDERTVECLLQGPKTDVEAIIAWLWHGPPSARVTDCRVVSSLPVDPQRPFFHVTY